MGQAISLAESTLSSDFILAQTIIDACLPHTGKSYRIGITGTPGVGKSTFIENYGNYLLQDDTSKLAVLAIDPSSSRSGGSILGDKTRMESLSVHPRAFIRPSASGGALGGVHRASRETILLCEAAGYNYIFIETVGVGQSEITVRSMVDFFLLLIQPGAGDELQGIKRGIMEIADALVVTKADGENITMARRAQMDYRNAIHLFPANESGWIPEVITVSALEKTGFEKVNEILAAFRQHMHKTNNWQLQRSNQIEYWVRQAISNAILDRFYQKPGIETKIEDLLKKVSEGKLSPGRAINLALE